MHSLRIIAAASIALILVSCQTPSPTNPPKANDTNSLSSVASGNSRHSDLFTTQGSSQDISLQPYQRRNTSSDFFEKNTLTRKLKVSRQTADRIVSVCYFMIDIRSDQ